MKACFQQNLVRVDKAGNGLAQDAHLIKFYSVLLGIKRKVKNVLCVILNIVVRWLGWEYYTYTTFL
jgi:hypothetical protein